MSGNINAVKAAWLSFQAEKKASNPVSEYVTQDRARGVAQRAAQEITVLEKNLAAYKSIARRARPSMNARVSKQVKKDIDFALKYTTSYIGEYERVYVAWKKLVKAPPKQRRVSLFPLTSKRGVLFTNALNTFFERILGWIENETIRRGNLAVLPHKTSAVNVRGKTLAEVKGVKSIRNKLKQTERMANELTRDLNQAKYDLASVANAKTKATKKWKDAQAKLQKSSRLVKMLRMNADEHTKMIMNMHNQLSRLRREAGRERPRPRTMGQIMGQNSNSNSNNDWAESLVRGWSKE